VLTPLNKSTNQQIICHYLNAKPDNLSAERLLPAGKTPLPYISKFLISDLLARQPN
jgi:hypothetical protein